MTARKPGRRPPPRTAPVAIKSGDFEGWECTVRADFPAKVLSQLQSGKVDGIIAALEVIIIPGSHNLPDSSGKVAEHLEDVDPYGGLFEIAAEAFAAISKLPPR